jgi:hypothetical protein
LGLAINGINGLFDKIEGAGLNPDLLSVNVICNAVIGVAAGSRLNFNSKTGTVSLVNERANSRIKARIDLCSFNEEGECK